MRCVSLLSGGLDSAVATYEAQRQGWEVVEAVWVDYGQVNISEKRAAKALSRSLGVRCFEMKVAGLYGGALAPGYSAEGIEYSSLYMKTKNTVPVRNSVLLSCAANRAAALGADAVVVGTLADGLDADTSEDFTEAMSKALAIGIGHSGFRIVAPVSRLRKPEAIRLGHRIGVPLGLTWTCYGSQKKPCRVCDACLKRAEAFKVAGMDDPALPQDERPET